MIYINGRFLTQKLSGSQRFAYEIIRGVIADKQLHLVFLTPNQPIDKAYDITGFEIKTIGKNKGHIWEQMDLPLFLNKNGKKLLVNLINSAPLFYKNKTVSILDMTTFINPKWFNKYFAMYYQFMVPIIAKNSRKIITISECSKRDIIKYTKVSPDKICILYCGVSKQFNRDNDIADEKVTEKLKLKKNDYLLAVSSLDPRKNFVNLVKAYSQIDIDVPPLVIVGSENKVFANSELKAVISNCKNIMLTGFVSDEELVALYRSAYLFIYPSLYEGFGMPPLEAMASGCPTIVSNNSSMPEVCGNASIYIEPYDIKSIKQGVLKLVNDPSLRAELISLGIERVKKFSWQKSSTELSKILKELI